jgi:hypothetical protein
MRRSLVFASLAKALFMLSVSPHFVSAASADVTLAPSPGGIYHSAHPDFGLRDDAPDAQEIRAFKELAGKRIVWSFVSFHWDEGLSFPSDACRVINGEGVVPLVGMMPWSKLEFSAREEKYTLSAIIEGKFDAELRRCAGEARELWFPIMVEFGPEANGAWFPWSGFWNGASLDSYGRKGHPDGPERFRDAYRRVIDIFREEGVRDVTWVFHISSSASPKDEWNSARYYYPGDDYIDWIGASVYGRLRGDGPAIPFSSIMDRIYPGLCAVSAVSPIALLELGVSESRDGKDKPSWMRDALQALNDGRYPRIAAISWWNKKRRADGGPTTLEIDSSPESLDEYRKGVRRFEEIPVWRRD